MKQARIEPGGYVEHADGTITVNATVNNSGFVPLGHQGLQLNFDDRAQFEEQITAAEERISGEDMVLWLLAKGKKTDATFGILFKQTIEGKLVTVDLAGTGVSIAV